MPSARPVRLLASPAVVHSNDNPYVELLYAAIRTNGVDVVDYTPKRLLAEPWDVVHIHWPELRVWRNSRRRFVVSSVLFLGGLVWARSRGATVVWTAHNVVPHDGRFGRLDRWFMSAFVHLVDGVISLSQSGTDRIRSAYPHIRRVPILQTKHGDYRAAYPTSGKTRAQCREELGLDPGHNIVLCLGQVRDNKQIDQLIDDIKRNGDADMELVVAGPVMDDKLRQRLTDQAADDSRISLRFGAVPHDEVGVWMQAADVAVVPYPIMNSGSAILPPSMDIPLVLPDSIAARELSADVDDGWIHIYDPAAGDSVVDAIRRIDHAALSSKPELKELRWADIARQTVDFYDRAMRHRRKDHSLSSGSEAADA